MVERVERELDKEFKYKIGTPATPATGTASSTVPTTAAAPTVTPAEMKTIELIPIGKVVPTETAAIGVAPEEPTEGPTGTPSTLLPKEAPPKMPSESTTHCKIWMLIKLGRSNLVCFGLIMCTLLAL